MNKSALLVSKCSHSDTKCYHNDISMIVISTVMTMLLISFIMFPAYLVRAKDLGVHGQTFEIKEENILELIQRRLRAMEQTGELEAHNAEIKKRVLKWVDSPTSAASLPNATKDRVFYYDPTFVLKENIRDEKGNIYHAAGRRINFLDELSLNGNLLFINGHNKEHVLWAIEQYFAQKNADSMLDPAIILSEGAVIELENTHGIKFYFDQGGFLIKKLGIRYVPALVTQENKILKILEVKLEKR